MLEQHSFETPDELVAFLTVIARNKVADAARARLQRQKYNLNREQSIEKDPLGADRFPASQQTPSEIVMDREEWDQFLEKQPLVHRRILILLREGKPSIKIAEELGVSQRTVNRVLRKVVPGTSS
jgi:RNA polymerase sigma factor (sigma-70 family)